MNSQFYIAAVISAILSSKVLFAAAREDALLVNASPIPPLDIEKLFEQNCYSPKNKKKGGMGHFCPPLMFHI